MAIDRDHLVELHQVCPGCGLPVSVNDQLHHLFIRRNPNIPELWDQTNIILIHPGCHDQERGQYDAAVMKLQKFGSEAIEAWVKSLPFKLTPSLPDFYYEARMEVESW